MQYLAMGLLVVSSWIQLAVFFALSPAVEGRPFSGITPGSVSSPSSPETGHIIDSGGVSLPRYYEEEEEEDPWRGEPPSPTPGELGAEDWQRSLPSSVIRTGTLVKSYWKLCAAHDLDCVSCCHSLMASTFQLCRQICHHMAVGESDDPAAMQPDSMRWHGDSTAGAGIDQSNSQLTSLVSAGKLSISLSARIRWLRTISASAGRAISDDNPVLQPPVPLDADRSSAMLATATVRASSPPAPTLLAVPGRLWAEKPAAQPGFPELVWQSRKTLSTGEETSVAEQRPHEASDPDKICVHRLLVYAALTGLLACSAAAGFLLIYFRRPVTRALCKVCCCCRCCRPDQVTPGTHRMVKGTRGRTAEDGSPASSDLLIDDTWSFHARPGPSSNRQQQHQKPSNQLAGKGFGSQGQSPAQLQMQQRTNSTASSSKLGGKQWQSVPAQPKQQHRGRSAFSRLSSWLLSRSMQKHGRKQASSYPSPEWPSSSREMEPGSLLARQYPTAGYLPQGNEPLPFRVQSAASHVVQEIPLKTQEASRPLSPVFFQPGNVDKPLVHSSTFSRTSQELRAKHLSAMHSKSLYDNFSFDTPTFEEPLSVENDYMAMMSLPVIDNSQSFEVPPVMRKDTPYNPTAPLSTEWYRGEPHITVNPFMTLDMESSDLDDSVFDQSQARFGEHTGAAQQHATSGTITPEDDRPATPLPVFSSVSPSSDVSDDDKQEAFYTCAPPVPFDQGVQPEPVPHVTQDNSVSPGILAEDIDVTWELDLPFGETVWPALINSSFLIERLDDNDFVATEQGFDCGTASSLALRSSTGMDRQKVTGSGDSPFSFGGILADVGGETTSDNVAGFICPLPQPSILHQIDVDLDYPLWRWLDRESGSVLETVDVGDIGDEEWTALVAPQHLDQYGATRLRDDWAYEPGHTADKPHAENDVRDPGEIEAPALPASPSPPHRTVPDHDDERKQSPVEKTVPGDLPGTVTDENRSRKGRKRKAGMNRRRLEAHPFADLTNLA